MASWEPDRRHRDLKAVPFFLYLLALAVAVLLVAGASNARGGGGPADLCPPPAHTTYGDACLPCTPTACRQAAPQGLVGCLVTVRVTRGVDYLLATGRVYRHQQGPGFEYMSLDHDRVQVNTIQPPLEYDVLRCPR